VARRLGGTRDRVGRPGRARRRSATETRVARRLEIRPDAEGVSARLGRGPAPPFSTVLGRCLRSSGDPLQVAPIHRPSLGRLVTEAPRAGLDLGAVWPLLATARRGDGHPVLVLPGWLTGDPATALMRSVLRALGHNVSGWSLGANRGPTVHVVQELRQQVERLHRNSGRRVSLVGWSLGGLYAQELARASPGSVRGLVTLASPVTRWPQWMRTPRESRTTAHACPARSRPSPGPGPSAAVTSARVTTRRCCGCWPTGSGWPKEPGHRSDRHSDSARSSPGGDHDARDVVVVWRAPGQIPG
jgi:pimeloyl-ACP methyl ester carboxylesterase